MKKAIFMIAVLGMISSVGVGAKTSSKLHWAEGWDTSKSKKETSQDSGGQEDSVGCSSCIAPVMAEIKQLKQEILSSREVSKKAGNQAKLNGAFLKDQKKLLNRLIKGSIKAYENVKLLNKMVESLKEFKK